MDEISRLFELQRASQRALRDLPWAEKLRLAVKLRDSVVSLRSSWPSRKRARKVGVRANDEQPR